ncbi:MAG: hypothetical protein KAG89_09730 [Fulvimarina manganoxydans]|nr:hypothetical protein [Fulvimarina manganoxydans]MCK5932432.1 hypothetical protein [Fulvimarina manganoxydans]
MSLFNFVGGDQNGVIGEASIHRAHQTSASSSRRAGIANAKGGCDA